MASTKKLFLSDIEKFLKKHKMSPTAFGRQFGKSPNFVFELRDGRAPSLDLVDRVDKLMLAYEGEA